MKIPFEGGNVCNLFNLTKCPDTLRNLRWKGELQDAWVSHATDQPMEEKKDDNFSENENDCNLEQEKRNVLKRGETKEGKGIFLEQQQDSSPTIN